MDIGVNADGKILPNLYVFNNPRFNGLETVEGSSFATPIVSGKLCANYDNFSGILNAAFDKSSIWANLGPSIVKSNPKLINSVNDGNIMKRLK